MFLVPSKNHGCSFSRLQNFSKRNLQTVPNPSLDDADGHTRTTPGKIAPLFCPRRVAGSQPPVGGGEKNDRHTIHEVIGLYDTPQRTIARKGVQCAICRPSETRSPGLPSLPFPPTQPMPPMPFRCRAAHPLSRVSGMRPDVALAPRASQAGPRIPGSRTKGPTPRFDGTSKPPF